MLCERAIQILNAMRGTVGILQQPAVIRSFRAKRLWALDDLDRIMPQLIEAKRAHDDRVEREGAPEES